MKQRHALRFENGERRGELWVLPSAAGAEAADDGAVTVGRRAGNACVLSDVSVSGLHAELTIDARGVTLRDLGSTNGTRVGNERVTERRLALGDVLHFGNVCATVVDPDEVARGARTSPGPAARPAAPPRPAAEDAAAGDDVHTVSASALARTRRVSPAGLAALLLIAAAAGGAWFWLRARKSTGAGSLARPVVDVPGNLLAEGYSFEAEASDGRAFEDRWIPAEVAPASFGLDPSARRTGQGGLSATVAEGEWAEHASEAVAAPRAGSLALGAWARAGGARAVLGLRFESAADKARPITIWSGSFRGEDFEPLDLRVAVPSGYDRARAVLHARAESEPGADGEGWVEFDDVSLVAVPRSEGDGTGAAAVGEYELAALGDPPSVVSLFKIDRVLFSGLAVESGGERASLAREARADGLALFPAAAGTLGFFAEPELASGGVATLAAPEDGGYRTHQVDFERERVRSILLGTGRDLVRVAFAAPVAARARPSAGGFLFEVRLEEDAEVVIQLAFQAERNAAQVAARDARAAEQRGEHGTALLLWGRVQDELPFDEGLLGEAEAARGRLISAGLAELRLLEQRFGRARFFRLVDDFRACRGDARALAQRYAASEVESGARRLEAEIESQLAELTVDLERHERERLAAIARSLEAGGHTELSERVQTYLREHLGAAAAPPESAPAEGAPAKGR